jgi:plastocyanin
VEATTKTQRKSRKIKFILIAVLLVIVGVSAWSVTRKEKEVPLPASSNVVNTQVDVSTDGFSPATITIKKGTTVTWTNIDDDVTHQIASDPHPTHTSLPGLFSPILDTEQKYSYTFDKTGTFTYHDESSLLSSGTVYVIE